MKRFELKNNGKVFFKEIKTKKLVKKHKQSIFRRKSSRNNRLNNVKRKNALSKLITFILILFLIAIVIFGIYVGVKGVSKLRNKGNENVNIGWVYGLKDVPEYPKAEFIFHDNLNEESIKSFISLGNSVYRITDDSSINDVFQYYIDKLPSNGWEHKVSVDIASEEMKYGEYWVKEGRGLRIYSRLNDIWYETTTVKEAETGLADVVKEEVARELLLLTTEKIELLPNFPWDLSFPSEYVPKYYATDLSSFQGVEISKIGSSNKVYIEPIGYYGAMDYDAYLLKYLKIYNTRHKEKWNVINSKVITMLDLEALRGIVTNGTEQGNVVIIKNVSNTLVYAISCFEENDPFFEYVIENIKTVEIVSKSR